MRRRELVAGAGSLVVLAGAGTVATGVFDGSEDERETYTDDPIVVETFDAPGSDAGTAQVPRPGQTTVIDFFLTSCSHCERELPTIKAAHDEIGGNDVRFLSVSNEPPELFDESELVDWWAEHGGEWPVAHDPRQELGSRYDAISVPVTIVLDGAGRVQFNETGSKAVSDIVDAVETAREAETT